jgi:3-hydroxyisobutyrate dehydrogenase-like beta-hydroxyacid dehydrogenase
VTQARPSVGVVGLGIMGSAVSPNLIAAGFPVVGYDVRREAREALEAAGGKQADSLAALAAEASVLLCFLPTVEALAAVSRALAASNVPPRTVIECSTLALDDKEKARAALEAAGHTLLDCPLSGTGAQARNRDLVVLGSGDQAAFERCRAVFDSFARVVKHVGPFGNGMRMKLVANLLVAVHNCAAAEALTLARKAGLDPKLVHETLKEGAGGSRMWEIRGPMMVERRYTPATMKIDVFQKDLSLMTTFAASLGCPVPLLEVAAGLYEEAEAAGLGAQDSAAVCAVLEKKAGL